MADEKQKDWRETPFEYPDFISWLEHYIGYIFIVIGLIILIGGLIYTHSEDEDTIGQIIDDLYANGGSELLSIAATVLIIDRLNARRSKRDEAIRERQIKDEAEAREKADLILQMGSPDNAFAREAVRKLRARGWLEDGALAGADLFGANLQEADLGRANLEGVQLSGANLQGVYLVGANLQGVTLLDTKFDEKTVLPDSKLLHRKYWTLETDMSRYTNPDHPHFWRSDDPYSPAYRGDEKDSE